MIMNLRPYPAMKDSGVFWLGKVPEHWEVRRIGALLRERGETNYDNNVTDVLSVMRERGVIPYAEKGNVGNKKSDDITRYKIVRPNDIVVNCMNVIIGSVGLSKYTGCLSPVYYVLTRRSVIDDPHYLNAYFQTKPFQLSLVRIGNGILAHRMRIPMELLKCELFPRPPAAEQAAIVRYLDYMDRRIRKYIRAKQKLIKLLEEQKRAIIYRAVTRGLDPNVRIKPSGVDWLGDVPEHWEEMSLGRCLKSIEQGWSPVAAEGELMADQWTVLTLSAVKRGLFKPNAIKPVSDVAYSHEDIEIKDGDLLLTRSNTRELVGDACIVQGVRPKTILCDLIYRLTPDLIIIDPGFLMFYLLSPIGRRQIESDARGSSGTMPKIAQRHIRSWRAIVPPIGEQNEIVKFIEREIKVIDDVEKATQKEIALLREYRTRLIADVVTGKLDVREAVANFPEETDEPEPLEEVEEPTANGTEKSVEEVSDEG